MENMKIVIDISKSLYDALGEIERNSLAAEEILNCVKNGIPLSDIIRKLEDDLKSEFKNVQDWKGNEDRNLQIIDNVFSVMK